MPRMIIGTNWFQGHSHTSVAKNKFIHSYQTADNVADILCVFLEAGIDAVLGSPSPKLIEAMDKAEQRTGRKLIRLVTPNFNLRPGEDSYDELPEKALDKCVELGATFCLPHQITTDALVDQRDKVIRDLDIYTAMIRERGMIPGLSTHAPETVVYADAQNADVETYIQIYNAAGFLMHVEADWVMNIICKAKKPVITIKPMAAGRLLPVVGLAFVWSTIREQDMMAVGTTTPDEARELIDISLDLLNNYVPSFELQKTRSKQSLDV